MNGLFGYRVVYSFLWVMDMRIPGWVRQQNGGNGEYLFGPNIMGEIAWGIIDPTSNVYRFRRCDAVVRASSASEAVFIVKTRINGAQRDSEEMGYIFGQPDEANLFWPTDIVVLDDKVFVENQRDDPNALEWMGGKARKFDLEGSEA